MCYAASSMTTSAFHATASRDKIVSMVAAASPDRPERNVKLRSLQLRVTAAEKAAFTRAAARRQMNASDVLRELVSPIIAEQRRLERRSNRN